MKTLTEVREAKNEEKELQTKELETARDALLESSDGLPALDGKDGRRLIYRDLLKNHSFYRCPPMLLGIACDNCKTELINKSPGSLSGYPPRRVVVCVGCGFSGYLEG